MYDPIYVRARSVLLDALDALGAHRANIVLIGAQAVYHWSGSADLRVAAFTQDADLGLDPRGLMDEPLLERALTVAGFANGKNPGQWLRSGVPVDIMVPLSLASPKGSRGVRIPPHSHRVARKAAGIEGCLVDTGLGLVRALEPGDERSFEVKVAGPASLIVAKTIKLSERLGQPKDRLVPKDALDIHRLLITRPAEELADPFHALRSSGLSREVTASALSQLRQLYADRDSHGPRLLAEALTEGDDPELERDRSVRLVRALLEQLDLTSSDHGLTRQA